jgi:sec-independent protein translocase protein TatA
LAFDDPIVIVLILAVVVLLFGASRIPQLARSLGQARREFDRGAKGEPSDASQPSAVSVQSASVAPAPDDPLVVAAQREGIETQGKTKEQIASELSWKLNRK